MSHPHRALIRTAIIGKYTKIASGTLQQRRRNISDKAPEDWTDEEIYQAIAKITHQFSILECADCAKSIRRWLRQYGISGKILRLRTRYGEDYILSDRLEQLGITESITINGKHFGVEVRGKVFDNLSEQGLSREDWLQDFWCHSGEFTLTELERF
ncbi:MAG: papain fold toxin domain-containing protein [Kovacikia sp.]